MNWEHLTTQAQAPISSTEVRIVERRGGLERLANATVDAVSSIHPVWL